LEVAKKYFTKELEKNLAQHKAAKRYLRYKLEVYQNNFLDFFCCSPISTKASDKDEEVKVRPNETTQEEEV
jgi:hypothetical protein